MQPPRAIFMPWPRPYLAHKCFQHQSVGMLCSGNQATAPGEAAAPVSCGVECGLDKASCSSCGLFVGSSLHSDRYAIGAGATGQLTPEQAEAHRDNVMLIALTVGAHCANGSLSASLLVTDQKTPPWAVVRRGRPQELVRKGAGGRPELQCEPRRACAFV